MGGRTGVVSGSPLDGSLRLCRDQTEDREEIRQVPARCCILRACGLLWARESGCWLGVPILGKRRNHALSTASTIRDPKAEEF